MNIFSDVGGIYLGENRKYNDLQEIIQLCGGKLVKLPTQATYIIGSKDESMQSISPNWIVDCIYNGQIIPVDSYK